MRPKAQRPWFARRVGRAKPGLIVNPTGRPGGNHERRTLELVEQGRIAITPGAVSTLRVQHDDWCGLLAGAQYCNCHPTINGIAWDE